MKRSGWLLLCWSILSQSFAQPFPQDYFRSPLDIPLLPSGSFAELRTNHFHTGLDIKTQGVEGLKVYAAAEGYISRVRVSHYGYGKVIYINHPNGYTTVYAHLSRFNPQVEKYVKTQQYLQETEEIDLDQLSDTLLRVQKGELIAYSGNTGSSGGPHLHYEIRETATEQALNPLLFGVRLKDQVAPSLLHLKIYPLNDSSHINGSFRPLILDIVAENGRYALKGNPSLKAYGRFGVALHTIDRFDGSQNSCGIYTLQLRKNDTLVFSQQMDRIDFSTTRYINAHKDFLAYKKNKQSYHKSFIDGNNPLLIYPVKTDEGVLTVSPQTGSLLLSYAAADYAGNTSTLRFKLDPAEPKAFTPRPIVGQEMRYDTLNSLTRETIKLDFPAGCFYRDLDFILKEEPRRARFYSPVYLLHDPDVPVQSYFSLHLKADSVPEHLNDKALIVFINEKGKVSAEGGTWQNGWISTRTRSFGKYAIAVDTLAPVLQGVNISNGKVMTGMKEFVVKASDDLSGIKSYKGYIDGKWVLVNYELKTGRMIFRTSELALSKGTHEFKLIVADERQNEATFVCQFTW